MRVGVSVLVWWRVVDYGWQCNLFEHRVEKRRSCAGAFAVQLTL